MCEKWGFISFPCHLLIALVFLLFKTMWRINEVRAKKDWFVLRLIDLVSRANDRTSRDWMINWIEKATNFISMQWTKYNLSIGNTLAVVLNQSKPKKEFTGWKSDYIKPSAVVYQTPDICMQWFTRITTCTCM